MIRIAIAILICIVVIAFAMLGWRGRRSSRPPIQLFNDMVQTPRYNPQSASPLFADGRAQRKPPRHAVPWGYDSHQPTRWFAVADQVRYRFKKLPLKLDRSLLLRGRKLFERNCAVCHGRSGAGNGITTQYGMNNPPSYHSDRLRNVTDGYIYQVISEGKATMGPYGDRIVPHDRWAIVAYVHVLQRAFGATLDDVPEAERQRLEQKR